ncbi:MAG: UDP-galactose-lipid carrier transferase [Polyangiaceae bacterium]|jgi:polyphosphate:AMP phosphotransferase|nr:UDP-galactose-lipid carrier transferase [Polyangiaceae bacterium]
MLNTADLGRSLSKEQYDAVLPGLRTAMLDAQARLRKAGFSVVVIVGGADGAGKSETVNSLHEWFDARFLRAESWAPPTEEESAHPEFWRYWLWLPAAGRIAVFSGAWYTEPIRDRVWKGISDRELSERTGTINSFERTLSDGGTLFVKLWFHIGKKAQRRRLKELASKKTTRFRVVKQDWKNHKHYDDIVKVTEQVISHTSTGYAPWNVIDGEDTRYRNITAGRAILDAVEARLAQPRPTHAAPRLPKIPDPGTLLDKLDLSVSLTKHDYEASVARLQSRLFGLVRKLKKRDKSAILVFEGPDAAGKGGAIRRITWALDARSFRLIPIAAPTDEERAHHYLWRFWRHLPRRGKVTIFDRSWYGRVLVERVEGFASEPEWQRAYQEINEFERELWRSGAVLAKFWLQISAEEQLRRFEERRQNPAKRYKITAEDYRNREQANQYEAAAADMIARCSPPEAPFTLVEANDKRFARVKILETLCDRLEGACDE